MTYLSRFVPFVKPYFLPMAGAGILVMSVAAFNLILIRLGGSLWDLITVQKDLPRLTAMVWVFIGLVIGQGVVSMGHSYLTAWVSQHVMADFRTHVFAHLHRLSLGFFAKRRTGELLSRLMNDVGTIQAIVTETPMDALKHLVTIVGGVGFLLFMNWRLCVLILVLLPLLAVVARLFGKRLKIALDEHPGSNGPLDHLNRRSDFRHPCGQILRAGCQGGRSLPGGRRCLVAHDLETYRGPGGLCPGDHPLHVFHGDCRVVVRWESR
jgi:ABC-type multidrug transport system fused ATPase/permease subunit